MPSYLHIPNHASIMQGEPKGLVRTQHYFYTTFPITTTNIINLYHFSYKRRFLHNFGMTNVSINVLWFNVTKNTNNFPYFTLPTILDELCKVEANVHSADFHNQIGTFSFWSHGYANILVTTDPTKPFTGRYLCGAATLAQQVLF